MSISPGDRDVLIRGAFEAKERSYSPYSRFRVGAALLSDNGVLIQSANIENASYGGTICAERTAIVKAVSDGLRSFIGMAGCGISAITLWNMSAEDPGILLCENANLLVPSDYYESVGSAEEVRETNIGELLPDSFGPEHLMLPRS